MTKATKSMEEEIRKHLRPVVCESDDDFASLCAILILSPDLIKKDKFGASRFLLIMFHEYLGLVLEDKMIPYTMFDIRKEDLEQMKKIIKELRETNVYKKAKEL